MGWLPTVYVAGYDFLRARRRTPTSRHRTTHRIDFGERQTNKVQATKVLPPIHRYRRCQIDAASRRKNSRTKNSGRPISRIVTLRRPTI